MGNNFIGTKNTVILRVSKDLQKTLEDLRIELEEDRERRKKKDQCVSLVKASQVLARRIKR